MARGLGEGGGGQQILAVDAVEDRQRQAFGEGARLVEHHRVHFRHPFEGGGALEERAPLHQPSRGDHLHRRHGEAEGAGTGDDEHRGGDQQRRLPVHAAQQPPAEEGEGGETVHEGGVEAGDAVGEGHVAAAPLLGQFHQPHDLGQQGALAHLPHPHPDGGGEVEGAGEHPVSLGHRLRHRLAGDRARVHLAPAVAHHPVDGDALAAGDQDLLARLQLLGAGAAGRAVGADEGHRARSQRQQAFGGGAGGTAGPTVQIAADQQEEEEGDGAVEIDVGAAAHGLEQAHRRGDQHRQRDRHVHVGMAGPERAQGGAEEGPAGIGDGRQRDQGLEPVEEGAGGLPHAREMAGPDRDRQQHDVAGGETRHRHRPQQLLLLAVVLALQPLGIVGHHPVAELAHDPGQRVAALGRTPPAQDQPPGGEIDAGGRDVGLAGEAPFDAGHAAAAMHPFHHEMQQPVAAFAVLAHEGQHVGSRQLLFRRQRLAGAGRCHQRRVTRRLRTKRSSPRTASTWISQSPVRGRVKTAR